MLLWDEFILLRVRGASVKMKSSVLNYSFFPGNPFISHPEFRTDQVPVF
jgi:hypothetical protein